MEIIDIATGEKVHIHVQSSADEDIHLGETTLTLEPERGSYFFWSTSPEVKWRKYPFDISGFSPNTKYTVMYRNHGFTEWSPAQQESRSHVEVQSEPIAVNLLNDMAPRFTPHHSLPPKTPVTSSLSTSTPICSLSGVPSLTIFLDWTLDGDRPICALMTQSRAHNIGVEISDPERKGRRIGPPSDWVCYDEDEAIPAEEVVLRSKRGMLFDSHIFLPVRRKATDCSMRIHGPW